MGELTTPRDGSPESLAGHAEEEEGGLYGELPGRVQGGV